MSKYYRHTPLLPPGPNGKASPTAHVPPPVDDKSIDLREIWYALRRGKWIILFTIQLFTAISVAYTLWVDPVYLGVSMVSVVTGGSRAISIGSTPENVISFGEQRSLQGELGILRNSVDLAERVVQRLEEAATALDTDEFYPVLQPLEGERLTSRKIAFRILDRVQFQGEREQNMIGITVESTAPQEVASIANFYAEEYEKYSLERSRASLVAARGFLEEQVEKYAQEIERLERQWEAFAGQKEVIAEGQGGERVIAEHTALSARRDEARFDLDQKLLSRELLQKQLANIEPSLEKMVMEERVASALENQIDAIDRQLADLNVQAETFYAVTPEFRGNEDQSEELKYYIDQIAHFTEQKAALTAQLVDEVLRDTIALEEGGQIRFVNRLRRRITEEQINIRGLRAQIEALDTRLLTYEAKLQAIPRHILQREQLERKLEQAERWYDSFLLQLQQTLIAEESELGYVKIVREAFVPSVPLRPNLKMNVILGLLLGIGIGTGLAFARQAMRTKLSKPEDLTGHGYPLLGVVPRMDKAIKASFGGKEAVEVGGKLLSTRLITHLDPWSPVAENFRLIRAKIQFAQSDRPIQSLLITSPEGNDGKSVTAVNTAIAMAQGGRRTLLIDADLRRPDIHKLLGLERTPGFSDILLGRHAFKAADFATDVPGLYCIPAGHIGTPPAELFGTERVKRFLDVLRERFDVIIIDSPPVLVVSDAVLLAPQCDATAIVVTADKTDLRALEMTQETLSSLGVFILGTIINRFDAKKAGGYKYGYSYYRDYYYDNNSA